MSKKLNATSPKLRPNGFSKKAEALYCQQGFTPHMHYWHQLIINKLSADEYETKSNLTLTEDQWL